ncbi:hypothetical protein DWV74_00315 [Megamonas funiformis]|jgi:chromosome segregation ATPase|uniref:hypothetical protein n=2 Tax=Megamonas funiformis TaxID=437897 RepID=UPI000E4A1C02|nr:hypothetical protein [Megamonas funiformis]RGW51183.1 hypothetical protein DWV74_00315 [Megamonas funiformis]
MLSMNLSEDIKTKYQKCDIKINALQNKRDEIINSINRLQKILSKKKIEKQEVDKNISELKEQKEILNLQQLAMTLKNNKVDINRLNVDKLAETIIEQEKENTLIQEDNSLDTLTIENNRKDDSNEIIHS